MASSVSIVSSVSQILSTCTNLSKTTSELIHQINNAPEHIQAIASDLETFNPLLVAARECLSKEETISGFLHPSTSSDVQDVVKHTMSIFQSCHSFVNDFVVSSGVVSADSWAHVKWTWKEKDIFLLRDQLSAHKTTFRVAIAVAQLINITKTDATTAQVDQRIEELKRNLAQLLTRLDIEEEWATETAVVRTNHETTLRRIANDAASVLSSVNPNEDWELSSNIDRVVATLASPLTPQRASSSKASDPSPDLEYSGSFYRLTLRFHGTPESVASIKKHFKQRAASIANADLAILCRNIMGELTDQDSTGARMDFFFQRDMYNLPQLRDFLRDHVGFSLPDDYELGDFAALSPRWIFWLHSMAETTYSGLSKISISEDDSNHWRMTVMRRLDDLDTSASESQVILHRPQEKPKDARLPDVYGYSTYWKELRNQLNARKRDSPHSDDSPRALTSEA